MEMEAAVKEAVPESVPSSAVQGRWVWKQVFEPCLPPPSFAAHASSERSAGAESEEPVPKRPDWNQLVEVAVSRVMRRRQGRCSVRVGA